MKKHGEVVDFLLADKRDLDIEALLAQVAEGRTSAVARKDRHGRSRHLHGRHRGGSHGWPAGAQPRPPRHEAFQKEIESDRFRLKTNMTRVGGFRSFIAARRSIQTFEAMLWPRKAFGFAAQDLFTLRDKIHARRFARHETMF
jgi:hypothetical protein